MAFKTLDEIRSKIARDLDLEEEEFIQPEEMIEYINDAISRAEAHIVKLGLRDKYFLTRDSIDMISGQEDYELPETIYANKILNVIFENGSELYAMNPIDSMDMFENIQYLNKYDESDLYRYLIRHDEPGEERLQIVPTPRDNVTDGITVWFYRDAHRLSEDTDVCDLPEIALQYLYQYVKKMIYEKERGPSWMTAKEELKEAETLMVDTLSQQIADPKMSELEKDLSVYREHS